VLALAAGGIALASNGGGKTNATGTVTAPPTSSSPTPSLATEAAQYGAAVKALAQQAIPFAQQIAANEDNATAAITSGQQQANQIEQASEAQATQSLNPNNPQNVAEQQCMTNATNTSTLGPQGTAPMMAAIQQCLSTYSNGNQAVAGVGQISAIGQQMIATVTSDLQKADAAFRSLAGVLSQETTLASDLTVPTALGPTKQALLGALETANADATTGSASGNLSQLSTAAQSVSGDLGALNAQTNSLVVAMNQG
jgi:hypothetical protein